MGRRTIPVIVLYWQGILLLIDDIKKKKKNERIDDRLFRVHKVPSKSEFNGYQKSTSDQLKNRKSIVLARGTVLGAATLSFIKIKQKKKKIHEKKVRVMRAPRLLVPRPRKVK